MADIAVAAALILVEDVLSFLKRETHLQKSVHEEVQDVKSIQAQIRGMDGREGSQFLKTQIGQVREVAYEIEDVLDVFKHHVSPGYHGHRLYKVAYEVVHCFSERRVLHEVSSRIKVIKRTMRNISLEEGSSSGPRVEDHAIHKIPKEDEIVGFDEHQKILLHHLLKGDSRCMKIWVVGIGGSGKTTLVKLVHESKKVLGKYDCRAWIHVSQTFKIDELLWSMLSQFCEGKEKSTSTSGLDVGAKLSRYLQRKMYLLVLDDIWSRDDYEILVNALPDGYPGSRIIVTTNNLNVASLCVAPSDYILQLKGLQQPDDWKLFSKKAFQRSYGKCPKELEVWSQKILEKCQGLPLAIAEVSSLLAKKREHPEEWKTLHDSFWSELASNSSLAIISRRLLPSYNDLSIDLKSCLLYFRIFQDSSIKRGRLIRLWKAEGFTNNLGSKSGEKVAEEYLNELIGRNLVHANQWDFDGRVSSCKVPNLLREFIILKSNEENFVTMLTEAGTSSGEKIRRLSINHRCANLPHFKSLSSVRTLFVFSVVDPEKGAQSDNYIDSKIRELLGHAKLLRVLDLQGACFKNFPKEIFKLTLLRYLSLRETNLEIVPKSIKELTHLETLDLRHTFVTKLPSEILGLKYLRHLLVYRYTVQKYVTFDSAQGIEIAAGNGDLSEIWKLTLIKANRHSGVIEKLKKMVQLRKVGLIDLKREDGKALCESIQEMKDLSTLDVRSASQEEYIDMDYMDNPPHLLQRLFLKGRLERLPGWISSLSSLVRLYLRWSRLKTSPLEKLQALPNLVELEMGESYIGETLEFKAETFKKLKILHLDHFEQLNMMIVEESAMPELAKLTICRCDKLEMLPLGILFLTKLEKLHVYEMHQNFIARLGKNSEDRYMIDHVRDIKSFTYGGKWIPQNFS